MTEGEIHRFIDVVVEAPIDHSLTYKVPAALLGKVQIACRVRVPLGRRRVVGYVIAQVAAPPPKVLNPREIYEVIDSQPILGPDLMEFTHWMSTYYCAPWGEVIKRAVLRKIKPLPALGESRLSPAESAKTILSPVTLTSAQQQAVTLISDRLARHEFHPFLLHGITGSGKTEVYLRVIEEGLARGRGAIVLVPEISMTPQILQRFSERFGERIAVLHSGLKAAERLAEWEKIRSGRCDVVIGARSALFAPVTNLGVVVVDEEHDPSYKQEETPRYHGRDSALMRAKLAQAVAILGSATPSLESFYNAELGRYTYLSLPERVEDRRLPQVRIVDLRQRENTEGSILSTPLREAVQARLERREQTLLFLNRRGFATYIQCLDCGTVLLCPNCQVSLVYHAARAVLSCHYCGFQRQAPEHCPECQGIKISYRGLGTQRVEREVARLFPQAQVARLDRDTSRKKGEIPRILSRLAAGEIDILIGTQMITKGHDYPGITLVGVILADSALHLPDFRASEHNFQILTQVAGRAGRGDISGEVIIQTYHPETHSIACAANHDYEQFCRRELSLRQRLGYPPYRRILLLKIEGHNAEKVEKAARGFAEVLRKESGRKKGIDILGPAPGTIPRLKNRYRWHLLMRGESAQGLQETLRGAISSYSDGWGGTVRLIVDVDPVDFV